MADPDFVLHSKPGEHLAIPLSGRDTPWWIRIDKTDLYVTVRCDDDDTTVEPEEVVEAEYVEPEGIA